MNYVLRIIGQTFFLSGLLMFIVLGIAFTFYDDPDNTFQHYDHLLQILHFVFLDIIAGILLMGFFKKDK